MDRFLRWLVVALQNFLENQQGESVTTSGNQFFLLPFDGEFGVSAGDDYRIAGERGSCISCTRGNDRVVQDADAVVVRSGKDGLLFAVIHPRCLLDPLRRWQVMRWVRAAVDELAERSSQAA